MLGTVVVGSLGAGFLVGLLSLIVAGTGPAGTGPTQVNDWLVTPSGMLVTNLTLAALIPTAQLSTWLAFGWRPRWTTSVVGGMRWGWLGRCALIGAATLVLINVVLAVIGGDLVWTPAPDWPWMVLVVVFTTPLQAAGEEYLFRGWIQQTVGCLFARPVVGALVGATVSTTLFALAHGEQNLWLFADRFAFGVVASYLVWRTGGLEASIALHGMNNLVAFGLTIAAGQMSQSLDVTESSPTELAINTGILLLAGGAVLLLARRLRVERLFRPPVAPPAPSW
jgi:membrane protease YdiL (CAAX protease family)